jgi:hypothetical protein
MKKLSSSGCGELAREDLSFEMDASTVLIQARLVEI